MTGFGAAVRERNGFSAQVEVRAVNHRGLKVHVRSRPSLGPFEKDLRDRIAARFHRGAVDATVLLRRAPDADHPPFREETARGYVEALRRLGATLHLDDALSVRDLLAVPGLFEEEALAPLHESEWPVVAEAAEAALEQADAMRVAEGAATATRLRELAEPVGAFVGEARAEAVLVIERQRERLHQRIKELCPGGLAPADEQALEREICLYADRADINEELDRLESHLAQFEALLTAGGEAGKRLEFLAQEFLREVNTSASKAGGTLIARRAVEVKAAVEKIKEQAANVE